MANYGKIVTPLSLLFVAAGIGIASAFGQFTEALIVAGIAGGIGVLLFFFGFARLVQGKERKIMGQLLRPKAAARGSSVWVFLFANIMPIVLLYTTYENSIFEFLGNVPPFPLAIIIGTGLDSVILGTTGFSWILFAYLAFHFIWLLGIIFSGKIPKIVYVFNTFIMVIAFSCWLNFGALFILWTLLADKTNIVMVSQWELFTSIDDIMSLIVPLAIGLVIMLISLILVIKLLSNLQKGFSNFNAKGGQKVVVFIFLILVYLLAISPLVLGIYNCAQPDAIYIASYINYIPIILLAIVVLRALTSIVKSVQDFSKQRTASAKGAEKTSTTSFGLSTAIFVVILFLFWAPIVLPLIDSGENAKNNSVFNDQWNGWSDFRESLITEGGYSAENIMSIQSSISTLGQLDPTKHTILVIPGPTKAYNPASEVPYFLSAFDGNFSMFICSDHGSAGTLMNEMFFASLGISGGDLSQTTPITIFPKGILIDNESYYKSPKFPIIKNFYSHPITTGVSEVVLGHATAFLGGDILASLGWNYVGYTSGLYSFVDTDDNGYYDELEDTFPFPAALAEVLSGQPDSPMALAGTFLQGGLPLGGYPQAVFSYKDIAVQQPTRNGNGTYSSRVFCATDASWLNNDLLSQDFDNEQLALNAMDWLACDRAPEDTIIVFDEAHLTTTSGRSEINSAASFGTTQGYVNWLSTNPILGLVYPLFAMSTLRKWIPKEGNKRRLQLRDLEEAERRRAVLKFRTSSFFAQKINWYREHHKYRKALLELFRRIARKVNRLLGDSGDRSVGAIMGAIQREQGRYLSKTDYKRIQDFFEFIADLKRNKTNIKDEREFEDWFLEMSWIGSKI